LQQDGAFRAQDGAVRLPASARVLHAGARVLHARASGGRRAPACCTRALAGRRRRGPAARTHLRAAGSGRCRCKPARSGCKRPLAACRRALSGRRQAVACCRTARSCCKQRSACSKTARGAAGPAPALQDRRPRCGTGARAAGPAPAQQGSPAAMRDRRTGSRALRPRSAPPLQGGAGPGAGGVVGDPLHGRAAWGPSTWTWRGTCRLQPPDHGARPPDARRLPVYGAEARGR
jgi:hypothetical protein